MRLNEISEKSRLVLKALAKGLSYEQLLAADHALTSHDVFRALSESPTRFLGQEVGSQDEWRALGCLRSFALNLYVQ